MRPLIACLWIGLIGLVSAQPALNCTGPTEALTACSGRGQCLSITECLCDDQFITWPTGNVPQCNYKQTQKGPAFLLNLFLGYATGAGAFVLGETAYGAAQVVLAAIGIIMICCLLSCILIKTSDTDEHSSHTGEKLLVAFYVFLAVLIVVILALWVTVLVKIGNGDFTDKNGAPLGDWF